MEMEHSALGREFAARNADAESRFTVAALPAWVAHSPVALDEPTDETFVNNGACLLLRDHQVDFTGPAVAYHSRMLWRVLTPAGAAAVAQFSMPFDPLLQRLEVHVIRVHRDGRIIEHASRDAFTLMRREQNLERYMLDGHITATTIVPDVRPGDVVENCWTLYESHPVIAGRASEFFVLMAPAIELRERLRLPAGRPVSIKYFGGPVEPSVREDNGVVEHSWRVARSEPEKFEDYTPPWQVLARGIQVSEFQTWADVSRLFAPLYEPGECPPPMQEAAKAIMASISDPADRMMAVLDAVQTRLRYLSVSLGEGGVIPRSVADIWTTGYGDCKDSSVLFVALARLCGVDAAPVLISTGHGAAMNDFLPTATMFDHCIVRAIANGKTYWIDPTKRYQPLKADKLNNSFIGWALPITEAGEDLTDMGVPQQRLYADLKEKLEFGDKVSDPARFSVELTFGGMSAESVRRTLANDGLPAVAERARSRYVNEWPRIADAEPLRIEEDAEQGTLTLIGRYTIAEVWTKAGDKAVSTRIVDHNVNGELGNLAKTDGRNSDIYLGFPRIVRRHTEVTMPKDWAIGETDTSIQIKGAVYAEKLIKTDTRRFVIDQTLTVHAPVTPASEAKGYAQLAHAMNDAPALVLTGPNSGDKFTGTGAGGKRRNMWLWLGFIAFYIVMRVLIGALDQSSQTSYVPGKALDSEPQKTGGIEKTQGGAPFLDVKNRDWLKQEAEKPDTQKKPSNP